MTRASLLMIGLLSPFVFASCKDVSLGGSAEDAGTNGQDAGPQCLGPKPAPVDCIYGSPIYTCVAGESGGTWIRTCPEPPKDAGPQEVECLGPKPPEVDCIHGSPIYTCVAGENGGTWIRTCPEPPSQPEVERVLFTTLYNMCEGFCRRELDVKAGSATLRSTADVSSGSSAVEESPALDPAVRAKILSAATQALSQAWESRYGCPDCADQGAYYVQIIANGVLRETTLDPFQHPSFFDPLIDAIKPVLSSHPAPNAVCTLNPLICTLDNVSLALGLNADGTIEATWSNGGDHSIFLSSCYEAVFEQENGNSVPRGGPACDVKAAARVLEASGHLSVSSLSTKGRPGAYRARGIYHQGCTPGKPIDEAGCKTATTVISNSIKVVE